MNAVPASAAVPDSVSEPMTSILIADDHAVMRSGLRMLLEAEEGLEVAAEAGDVPETIRKLKAYKPDILLLDLHMPGGPSLAAIPEMREASPANEGPPDDLSEREVEVLRLIALGHTNAEIAQQLYLSVRTVESHRSHIQQKLRLTTRAELVRYALEHGLVEP